MNKKAITTLLAIEILLTAAGGLIFMFTTSRGQTCETAIAACGNGTAVNYSWATVLGGVLLVIITLFGLVIMQIMRRRKA